VTSFVKGSYDAPQALETIFAAYPVFGMGSRMNKLYGCRLYSYYYLRLYALLRYFACIWPMLEADTCSKRV